MLRERREAEKIVIENYSGLKNSDRLILINHYQKIHDWACKNCYQTGSVFKVTTSLKSVDCMCKFLHKKKQIADKLFKNSSIPEKYAKADLKTWNNVGRDEREKKINDDSMNVIHSYISNLQKMLSEGYGLYLSGPNGVGKTFLASVIGRKITMAGYSVKYFTMATIVSLMISSWSDDELGKLVKDIKSVDFLIIDDLDKIYSTKTGIEIHQFDTLLRERVQRNRPCIFTSNRTMANADENYGTNIGSMLKEHCAELVFVGADYRELISRSLSDKIIK